MSVVHVVDIVDSLRELKKIKQLVLQEPPDTASSPWSDHKDDC